MYEITLPSGGTLTILERADWDDSGEPRKGHPVDQEQFERIVLHHTVNVYNESPGFSDELWFMRTLRTIRPDLGLDVPYHWVGFAQANPLDAVMAEGRGWHRTAAHSAGLNSSTYGVALAGDYRKRAMTRGMIEAVRWLGSNIDNPGPTTGHRDHKATVCPGPNAYSQLPLLQPPFTNTGVITMSTITELTKRVEELEAIAYLSKDPGDLVDKAYLKVLGRKADRGGRQFWLEYLTDGGSVADMLALFRFSPEAGE